MPGDARHLVSLTVIALVFFMMASAVAVEAYRFEIEWWSWLQRVSEEGGYTYVELPNKFSGQQVSFIYLGTAGIASALFLLWQHGAARARGLPWWWAAGWFVPVANLWFPYIAMSTITKGSNPGRKAHPLVGPWWGLILTTGLLHVWAAFERDAATWVWDLIIVNQLLIAATVTGGLAALCAAVTVVQITSDDLRARHP